MTPIRPRSYPSQAHPMPLYQRPSYLRLALVMLVEAAVLIGLLVAIPACLYLLAQ